MRSTYTNYVGATTASALVFGADATTEVSAFDGTLNVGAAQGDGAQTVAALRRSRDSRYPSHDLQRNNCWLRWTQLPPGYSGNVEMVVHLHGFTGYADESHPPRMNLGAKAGISGLLLTNPGVPRATVGLVPHGVAGRWVNSRTGRFQGESFNFPHVSTAQQLDTVLGEVLGAFGPGRGALTRGRVILTAHSGGGARLLQLLRSTVGSATAVHGVQLFDATYGGPDWPVALRPWVEAALDADIALIGAARGDTALQRMRMSGHYLRVAFLGGTSTQAQAIDRMLVDVLAAKAPDAGLRTLLRKFYRAQRVVDRGIQHNDVPNSFGGRLLADPGNDLSPQAQDLPAAAVRAHAYGEDDEGDGYGDSYGAGHADGHGQGYGGSHSLSDEWEDGSYETAAWEGEAFDVTMPQVHAPARPGDAPSGSAFIASLGDRKGVERENRIFEQIRAGNMPSWLRTFHTVRTSANDRAGQRHEIEFYVTPDVITIGSDGDNVRIPTDPVNAQRIADLFDCLLPTARMVEQLYQAAPTKLAFIPGNYAGTPRAHLQDASSSYLWHSQQIDGQLRRPPTILTAGHKKEIVISNGYMRASRNKTTGAMGPARPKLAFYGAYTTGGVPIQAPRNGGQVMRGYPSFAHEPVFVDYSHGVRLVWPTMKVDGAERRIAEVLRDPNLSVLIAAEGPINEPRYTLDRAGHTVTARSAAAAYEDPLGLAPDQYGSALGYGTTWDQRICQIVEGFLAGWRGIPVRVGTQTIAVHPPYFMNVRPTTGPGRTRNRHDAAQGHRRAAPPRLRAIINERRFFQATIGKGTPEEIRDLLQAADAQGVLTTDPAINGHPSSATLRAFLARYGIGIDCSGFVSQAINRIVDQCPGATAADRIAQPHNTPASGLQGGTANFERVTDPAQLCAGDTMWLNGHIRILSRAERRADGIYFCTAESRSTPDDIGPAARWWRLVPDRAARSADFVGHRLERTDDPAGRTGFGPVPESGKEHRYGHYRPLRRLLGAAGVTPTALDLSDAVTAFDAPPRTAITTDLTQAEVDRLAAIRFRNAAEIETFFRRGGQASFIDWYNAGLARSAPFRERGATETSRIARERFTAFWNQIRTAFDRDEITALDFAAFTAISINETGGHLWAHPENSGRRGGGRTDASGRHPGLAYFFDRIIGVKSSYNMLRGGRTAGSLFNDADFIDAHGSLAGAAQLANHGSDFHGAWNGSYYPQGDFSTNEDPAANGFIMQADFYKFRGRGVIQTTSRGAYRSVVNWIKGYRGSNTVLADYARRWASYSNDVACTRSTTDDWDRIFGQSEMLAKGVALHARGFDARKGDYREMSRTAATLLHVPPESDGNAIGTAGSIYAMGRRISGKRAYGGGIYRQRVLALLHGFLTL